MPDTVQIDTTFSRLKSRSSSWFQEFEERFNRTLLIEGVEQTFLTTLPFSHHLRTSIQML